MRILYFALSLFTILFCSNCKKKDEPVPTNNLEKEDSIDSDDYTIYSAVINQNKEYKQEILVGQATIFGLGYFDYLLQENPGADTSMFENYRLKNYRSFNLGENLHVSPRTAQILSEEYISFLNLNPEVFEKNHPKSDRIIDFSRVGYNLSNTEAVVSVSSSFKSEKGPGGNLYKNAYGSIIYLKKINGEWQVIKVSLTWIT